MNTRCRICMFYCILYTYIYETTNTFSCVRCWRVSEMSSIPKRVDNLGAYQVANSWKPISGMLRTCRKAIVITLRYTPHVYLKCLDERYGYIFSMKDYNVLIFSSTLQRHSFQGFLRFL